MTSIEDVLSVRLFGYGVPYRVEGDPQNGVKPQPAETAVEAAALAAALSELSGGEVEEDAHGGQWTVSMPFGRCGWQGRPHEHLMVHHAAEAYIDVLQEDGPITYELNEGQLGPIMPRTIARLRARALPGKRVLVAFQTQDRTPLLGNAAPFIVDGEVPEDFGERLVKAHAQFEQALALSRTDRVAYGAQLGAFFEAMARDLAAKTEVAQTYAQAEQIGTYNGADEALYFTRQRQLLSPDVLQKIAAEDAELFRFPGMFGAITTLFNALNK